jgi:hypothetical protein
MLKRFPRFQELVPVYAVIFVMLSGWTIVAFLWKLPAWILMLTTREIFTIFSYSMFTNLLESLTVLLILLIACALLPSHFLHDDFIVRGTILAVGLIGSVMLFLGSYIQLGIEKPQNLLIGPTITLLLTVFLLVFSAKFPQIRSAALWISDRLIVFLLVLVPLSLALSSYVILRMIL